MGLPFLGCIRRAFTILLGAVTASSYLSCSSQSSDAPILPPPDSSPRIELHTQSLRVDRPESDARMIGPGFFQCLTTLPEPLYMEESGLRLRICFSDEKETRDLQGQWDSLDSSSRELGSFQTGSHRDLMQILESARVLFFYDGNGERAMARLEELHGQSELSVLSSRFIADERRDRIQKKFSDVVLSPRKYPQAIFSFALLNDRLILIFPSDFSQRLHWLSISLTQARVRELQSSLKQHYRRLKATQRSRSEIQSTETQSANIRESLSELYNRSQLELKCQKDGIVHFRFRTDNRSYDEFLPCRQDAILLLKRNPRRKISFIEDEDARISVPYVSEGRSLDWNLSADGLTEVISDPESADEASGYWSLKPCYPCHTLGFLEKEPSDAVADCELKDIDLKEWNLLGLLNPDLDAGGRFLEFRINERCKSGALRIVTGNERLLFAESTLDPGIYLIVADASLFSSPVSTKATALQEDAGLRRVAAGERIELLDLTSGESRLLKNSDNRSHIQGRNPHPGPARSIHSHQSASFHSFHPPYCAGLIADLCSNGLHGMSPGYAVKSQPLPRFQLDELLPAGTSSPEEEFLEFRNTSPYSDLRYIAGQIKIHLESENRDYQFVRGLPKASAGRWAIMRNGSDCYANAESVIQSSDFRIPNEPFQLKIVLEAILSNGTGWNKILLDRWFGPAYQDRTHSHLAANTLENGSIFKQHAESNCHNSSPGQPGHYRPEYSLMGLHRLRLRWLGDSLAHFRLAQTGADGATGSVHERWISPGISDLLFSDEWEGISSIISVEHLESESSPPLKQGGPNRSKGSPRTTVQEYRLWHASGPDSSCTVQAVHSSAPEWIRLCFPEGATEGLRLSIEDDNSIDSLVPASKRIPVHAIEAYESSIQPNECALIIDPDVSPEFILNLDKQRDRLWLMPETGAALGNGLRSDEGFRIRIESGNESTATSSHSVLCTFGNWLPAEDQGFSGNEYHRKPGTFQDSPENYRTSGFR